MFLQKKNREKGFSLVEVLVVAGIMGIIVVATSSVFVHFSKMMNRVEARQDMVALGTHIQSAISAKNTCEQALGVVGSGTVPIVLGQAQQPTNLSSPNGFPITMTINGEALVSGGAPLNQYPVQVNFLHLNDATLAGQDSNGWDVYRVSLNGSFSSTRPVSGTSYTKGRRLGSFFIKVQSGLIQSCFSLNSNDPGSLDDLTAMMCAKFGGTYNPTTKECDGVAGPCSGNQMPPSNACGQGQVQSGPCYCTVSGWHCPCQDNTR